MQFSIKNSSNAKVSGGAMEASQPLPDLVPTPHLSPSAVRRARSQSVNLPPATDRPLTIASIGRTLRRLSDEFEGSRVIPGRPRRNTVTSYYYCGSES